MIAAVASAVSAPPVANAAGTQTPLLSLAEAQGGKAALRLVQLMVYELSGQGSAQLVQQGLTPLGSRLDVRA
jgi:hypothetical protein